MFGNRAGVAGVAAVVAGTWLLCLSFAAAVSTAYPAVYVPFVFLAAIGVALVVSGGVVAGVFL
jgi:hypothetical protein